MAKSRIMLDVGNYPAIGETITVGINVGGVNYLRTWTFVSETVWSNRNPYEIPRQVVADTSNSIYALGAVAIDLEDEFPTVMINRQGEFSAFTMFLDNAIITFTPDAGYFTSITGSDNSVNYLIQNEFTDTTAPTPVTDLTYVENADGSLTFSFSPSVDDFDTTLRYSLGWGGSTKRYIGENVYTYTLSAAQVEEIDYNFFIITRSFLEDEVNGDVVNFNNSGIVNDTEAPSVPLNLAASNLTVSSIDLDWDASTDNSGVTGYNIFVDGLLYASSNVNSITLTGLAEQTEYQIKVRAYDAVPNFSEFSSEISVSTLQDVVVDTENPEPPTSVTTSNITEEGFNLSWDSGTDNVGILRYDIYINGILAGTTQGNTFSINGLNSGEPYSVILKTIDTSGNESEESDVTIATTNQTGGNNEITIINQLADYYPVHNNSFVEFSLLNTQDLFDTGVSLGQIRGTVTLIGDDGFSLTNGFFIVYADTGYKFMFNFIESVRKLYFDNKFEDVNEGLEQIYYSNELKKVVEPVKVRFDIVLHNGDYTVIYDSYTFTTEYVFKNAVYQPMQKVFSNSFQLLSYSCDGNRFNLTYFEGFPFSFAIQNDGAEDLKILNKTSSQESEVIEVSNSARAFHIDNSDGDNWTSSGFLALRNMDNNMRLISGDTEVAELVIRKKKVCEGIYLRWWNGYGWYNNWLFDKFYKDSTKVSSLDSIANNDFNNVGDLDKKFSIIGKTATRTLTLKTKCNDIELKQLESLFVAPLVKVYSSNLANKKGEFYNVEVKSSFEYSVKRNLHSVTVVIELPEVITAKL